MTNLICSLCHKNYPLDTLVYQCSCGGLLDLDFQPTFDLAKISARKPGMWRYREALPVFDEASITSFDEGFTPLLIVEIAGYRIHVKQDHLFPSGSYKDRGASVLVSHAREIGVKQVVEDSSGNAGCAVAAYCARAGIGCDIYVPDSTSPGKLAQIERYGAQLHKIPGSREDTARAVLTAAETKYYASHSYNPFFFHGTKTWAYEVAEQLGWRTPDTVILPAGNGTLLLGAHLGFTELLSAGLIDHLPRIIAIQAAACAPLEQAYLSGLDHPVSITKSDTLAEGIAIAEPVRGAQILAAVKESGGEFLTVSENEIITALKRMTAQGFYIEPTSAAVIAGVEKYMRTGASERTIVTVFTGHGLKATEKMLHIS